jgi:hypothetical protein
MVLAISYFEMFSPSLIILYFKLVLVNLLDFVQWQAFTSYHPAGGGAPDPLGS